MDALARGSTANDHAVGRAGCSRALRPRVRLVHIEGAHRGDHTGCAAHPEQTRRTAAGPRTEGRSVGRRLRRVGRVFLRIESLDVALESPLTAARRGDHLLEAGALGLALAPDLRRRLRRQRALEIELVLGLVVTRVEYLAHEHDVFWEHPRERRSVDPRPLELGEHLVDLSKDGDLAAVLEVQGVERLLPAPRAHDLVNVHGNKIMEDVERAGHRPPGIVLASAAGAQAAVAFVSIGLPSIGPELSRSFQLSLAELGAVLTAGLFGSGLTLIAAGMAVDRFGTRAPMLFGTVLGVAGLGVAATADSAPVLAIALVVFGVGSATVPIAGTGALFRAYPPARRGWALGVRQMSVPLGGTVAALAMPALEDYGGIGLTLGVAAVGVAITGLLFAYVAADPPRPVSARVHQPLRNIWRTPGMRRLLAVAAFYIVVLQAVLAFTVPAARAAGLTAFAASATFFAVNISAMVSRIAWGHVADRSGGSRRARTLVEVGVVAAVGALLFALSLHFGAVVVVAAAVLFGFGALGWNALVYVSAGERAAPELAARSVAVAATVVFLISAIATPLLGALASHAGWDVFWIVTAVLATAGALVAASLPATAVR